MFENMDWELLQHQKETLLRICESIPLNEDAQDLIGVINLIDAVQDHAVDVLGLDENIVFNLTED